MGRLFEDRASGALVTLRLAPLATELIVADLPFIVTPFLPGAGVPLRLARFLHQAQVTVLAWVHLHLGLIIGQEEMLKELLGGPTVLRHPANHLLGEVDEKISFFTFVLLELLVPGALVVD